MRKRKHPYISRNMPKKNPCGRGGTLRESTRSTRKMTRPSSIASYSCDGCRYTSPPVLANITPHGSVVSLPHSSPLTKLAQRPKKRPTGAPHTARSAMVGNEIPSWRHVM